MAGPQADSTSPANQAKPAVPRRFIGVRQRPSGRWVAEIKDSSQRMRLWLGTFDSPEEAARAYDEAARALRGDNARTNFATSSPMTSESSSPADGFSPEPEGRRGVNFTSLKAKLSKNLQSIIARSSENKAAKSRVSDHFTVANIFHRHRIHHHHHHQPLQLDTMTMEKLVQPSFIVPHITENRSWDSTSGFDHSGNANLCESIARFAPLPSDSNGSNVGEMGPLMSRLQFDHEEMAGMGWIDGNKLERESESKRGSKRFKVSSSVIVPPSFSANEFHDLSH